MTILETLIENKLKEQDIIGQRKQAIKEIQAFWNLHNER